VVCYLKNQQITSAHKAAPPCTQIRYCCVRQWGLYLTRLSLNALYVSMPKDTCSVPTRYAVSLINARQSALSK
jgi:hypothetical protein